ncbi:MAG: hypothetical protein HYR60_03320 [Acidobacteria bacterium]|nr:hypothetical protein [Acidobacteriota bacterium]
MNTKRLFIATILGLLFGLLNWLFVMNVITAPPLPLWPGALTIILGRGALGFAIGLSAWRIPWWLHGLVLGFIFSLPAAFVVPLLGMTWIFSPLPVLAGMLIGLLIELITSVGLKARTGVPTA